MSRQNKFSQSKLRWFIFSAIIVIAVGIFVFNLINLVKSQNGVCESTQYKVVLNITSPPLPTTDIKARPTGIGSYSDGPITINYNTAADLQWTSTNATSCTASNAWSGAKATSGTESTGNLTSSKTYTLTCTGPGGSASDTLTINVNSPPSVSVKTAIWNCCADSLNPDLSWNYSDSDTDPQASYWLQIKKSTDDWPASVINIGEVFTSSNTYHPPDEILVFNTAYNWRVKVKDNQGNWSLSWSDPVGSFTTPKHAYPDFTPPYNFTWSPQKPSAMEPVQFTDHTKFDNGGSSWFWTFESAVPATSVLQNPVATFSAPGNWEVILEVTDNDGYSCSTSDTVNVSKPLPEWKEVIPK